MKNFELKNDPIISHWLMLIEARPNNESYLQAIKAFC
jgi:hypothetical protein